MKRILSFLALLTTVSLAVAGPDIPQVKSDKLVVIFFGSRTCGECAEIKEAVLKPFAADHPEQVELRLYDTEDTAAFSLMQRLETAYGVTRPSPQELFLPDTVLLGFEPIMAGAPLLLEELVLTPESWVEPVIGKDSLSLAQRLQNATREWSVVGISLAGLVDGVNPCAIATMIFLVSFLATQKRRRTEVLAIGLSFCAAVFTTYYLMGLGAFEVLMRLTAYYWLSIVIKWSAVALAGGVAVLSFWDAFAYARSGDTKDIKLQLSKGLKMRIHKVISGNLSSTGLLVGAAVTGFMVTLLEAVCTGQVYLPTIKLMVDSSEHRFQGLLYLAYYNFLFVLPLLVIMVLAYYGMTWNKLAKATQKNMVLIKVLLGVVMAGLAVFLGIAG